MPLKWTELRDFAFSEDGYSVANRNKSSANGSNGSDQSGSSDSAAVGGGGAGGAGGARGTGAAEDRPIRWDQPFHHTVPSFPMPRMRPAPWGEIAPGGGAEGGGEEGREEGGRGGERESVWRRIGVGLGCVLI